MPEGRSIKYVSAEHPFMIDAKKARNECAGDPLYPVGIVLVKDGQVVVRSGNGFNKGKTQIHVCPRIVMECPSGEGYDLCDLHNAEGHAEAMLMEEATKLGIDTKGADVYMYGHWWACEPCWNALIDAGIQDVYVTEDAHERFHRDVVYAQTLNPTVKSAYIAGPITNVENFEAQKQFYELIGQAVEEMGCTTCIPHRDNGENQKKEKDPKEVYRWCINKVEEHDVVIAEVSTPSLGTGGELVEAVRAGKHIVLLSKKGSRVSSFVRGNPAVVYHIEYDSPQEAVRQLKNVLKQL